LLGERFAAARRTFERRWGCHNLELPISQLCRTTAFAWFACHLLANLLSFHSIYNACVHDYRRRHGIRSRRHPVPDLAVDDAWLETPFWAWRAGDKRRGRLFAQVTNEAIHLRVGNQSWPVLPGSSAGGESMTAAWLRLESAGLKVRSRALTNTLYARLFLADLFVHGIGGGKYDEVTDAIVHTFYGFEPPEYLVLSSTLLLPLPLFPVRRPDRQRLAWQLHDLHQNPQRHFDALPERSAEALGLAAEKQAWIGRQPMTKRERRVRFHTLRSLTERMRPFVARREQELRQELTRFDEQLAANGVLGRRDYAFCLYPEEVLRPFCMQVL
jgi:hypothetical protein